MSSDQEQASEDALRAPEEEANRDANRNQKRFRLRSLLRFRLSYLLILITIIAVILGAIVREARNEAKVLELWEDETDLLFASFYRLSDPPENVESYPRWYREVFSGMLLQNIESIDLENEDFEYLADEQMSKVFRTLPLAVNLQEFSWLDGVPTNQLIVGLSRLSELRELDLTDANLEPEAFTGISRLKSLTHLDLQNSNFEGKDVFSLRNFPVLEVLDLRRTRISDSVVQQLCDLPLKRLSLSRNNLTPAAFARLSQLDELEELELVGLEVDLRSCNQIAQLSNLRELDLSRTTISDAGVRALSEGVPALETLTLDYCQRLSDAAMEPIAKLSNLKELSILGSNVSPSGVELLAGAKLERIQVSPDAISVDMLRSFHADVLETSAWGKDPFGGTGPDDFYLESVDADLSRDVVRELLREHSTSCISLQQVPVETSDLTALKKPVSISLVGTEVDDSFLAWLNEDQDSLFHLELRDNAITAKGLGDWDLPLGLTELWVRDVTFPAAKLHEVAKLMNLESVEFESEPEFEILLQFLAAEDSNESDLGSLDWFRPAGERSDTNCTQRKPCVYFRYSLDQFTSGCVVEVGGTEFSKVQLQQILALCDVELLVIHSPRLEHLQLFSSPGFEDVDLRLADVHAEVFNADTASRLSVHSLSIKVPDCPMARLAAFVENLPEGIALDLECSPRDLKAELPSVISLLDRKTAKVVVNLNDLADVSLLVNSDAQDWGDDCRIAGKTIELKRLRDWMSGDPFTRDTMSLVLAPNLGTKEQLTGLRDLKYLDQVCWIGDDSSTVPEEIFACQHLDYLTFSNCQVSGTLVRKIALLQSVLGLVFYNCELDSAAYRELSELHLLESISFENCKLQPDELRNFTPPRGLEYMYFDTCEIDPGCIPIIETWTSLSQCVPADCNLSRAQLRRVYRR